MIYKVAYYSLLYYKCTEKYLYIQPVLYLDKIINIIKENKDVKFFLTCLNKEEQSIFKNAIDFALSEDSKYIAE